MRFHSLLFRPLLAGALAILTANAPFASGFLPYAAQAAALAPSVVPIRGLYVAIQKSQKPTLSPRQRYDIIAPAVAGAFDLPAMLRRILGTKYESLPPAQIRELNDAFTHHTVTQYVSNFSANIPLVFSISAKPVPGENGLEKVTTSIRAKKDEPSTATKIDYEMMRTPEGRWVIHDILLNEGISQVAMQRSEFRAIFRSGGAEALIQDLKREARTSPGA